LATDFHCLNPFVVVGNAPSCPDPGFFPLGKTVPSGFTKECLFPIVASLHPLSPSLPTILSSIVAFLALKVLNSVPYLNPWAISPFMHTFWPRFYIEHQCIFIPILALPGLGYPNFSCCTIVSPPLPHWQTVSRTGLLLFSSCLGLVLPPPQHSPGDKVLKSPPPPPFPDCKPAPKKLTPSMLSCLRKRAKPKRGFSVFSLFSLSVTYTLTSHKPLSSFPLPQYRIVPVTLARCRYIECGVPIFQPRLRGATSCQASFLTGGPTASPPPLVRLNFLLVPVEPFPPHLLYSTPTCPPRFWTSGPPSRHFP